MKHFSSIRSPFISFRKKLHNLPFHRCFPPSHSPSPALHQLQVFEHNDMTETHKNNGTLLLRDHLFRSPTWGCGETVVLLPLSEYHSFECSECHDNTATERETDYITRCLLGRKTVFWIRVFFLLFCFSIKQHTAAVLDSWHDDPITRRYRVSRLIQLNVKQLLCLSHNHHSRKWHLLFSRLCWQ